MCCGKPFWLKQREPTATHGAGCNEPPLFESGAATLSGQVMSALLFLVFRLIVPRNRLFPYTRRWWSAKEADRALVSRPIESAE